MDYIRGTSVLFSLYTYDSFLFDIPTDVDKSVLKDLKEIVEGSGFPVKGSMGTDYSIL